MPRNEPRLDAFTRAYIEAMLWSTMDQSDESGGEPLDKNYSAGDIAPETMELIVEDCADFQERFADLLSDSGIDDDRAGHDFWLSREGHGSGFFDEDSIDDEFQEPLQDAAGSYGGFDLQVDDGVIYGPPPDWYREHRKPAPIASEATSPRFADVRAMLLDGLKQHGWTVVDGLKVPHATSPDGRTRLWFKTQAVYVNDPGTDPRQFSETHSLSSDIREYKSVDDLLADVTRRNGLREPKIHHVVRDFNTLPELVEHARQQDGATHVIVLGKKASLFYPTGRYWNNNQPQYEAGKVWQQGGYWHSVAPSARTPLPTPLPGGTETIEAYLAGSGRQVSEASEPAFKRPGTRVKYNYTDGPVPPGTLGTVLGFLPRSQQAQIRWDDETVSNHTPDEYDVVRRGSTKSQTSESRRVGAFGRRSAWPDWQILDAIDRGHALPPESERRAVKLAQLGFIDTTGTWRLTTKGRAAIEQRVPVAAEAKRSGRARGTTKSAAQVAAELSKRVNGSVPKPVQGDAVQFTTYSPEYGQKVVVVVEPFEGDSMSLSVFSDEGLSETARYENISSFTYGPGGYTSHQVDVDQMVEDIDDVKATVDGYAASWQEAEGGEVDESPRGTRGGGGGRHAHERRRTLWSDWDILESVEKGHGMTPEAEDRAFELIDLGYIDATGTWELTDKGRRAWERDAPRGGWSDHHERLSASESRHRRDRRGSAHKK